MDTREVLRSFEEQADWYTKELANYSLEQLREVPEPSEWSLGQMYVHLIGSALHMQLRNAERILNGEGDENGEKTADGKAVFELGGFPPTRVRVPPNPQYTPTQPDTIEQLADGIGAVAARMRELAPRVAQDDGRRTVSHPRLGGLQAAEWFQLVEMHYRHHRLQKARLDEMRVN